MEKVRHAGDDAELCRAAGAQGECGQGRVGQCIDPVKLRTLECTQVGQHGAAIQPVKGADGRAAHVEQRHRRTASQRREIVDGILRDVQQKERIASAERAQIRDPIAKEVQPFDGKPGERPNVRDRLTCQQKCAQIRQAAQVVEGTDGTALHAGLSIDEEGTAVRADLRQRRDDLIVHNRQGGDLRELLVRKRALRLAELLTDGLFNQRLPEAARM